MTPTSNVITLSAAPKSLSAEARRTWQALTNEYCIDDAAGLAILGQLCETLDRLRECEARIQADGLIVAGYNEQPRPNPLLKTEAEYRRLILAQFRALKLGGDE